MSKRLQVVVPDAEYQRLRRIARSHRTTLAEWVRRVLRSFVDAQWLGQLNVRLTGYAAHAADTSESEGAAHD